MYTLRYYYPITIIIVTVIIITAIDCIIVYVHDA